MEQNSDTALDPTVALLRGLKFSAKGVMAVTGMTQDVLTNVLSKVKPTLCSESGGQGRSRQFCLVDVYQLLLLHRLTQITGKANWSARALEYALFNEVSLADVARRLGAHAPGRTSLARRRHISHLRSEFCADIQRAPEVYWARAIGYAGRTRIAVADQADIAADQYRLRINTADSAGDGLMFAAGGHFLNITRLFRAADVQLTKLKGVIAGEAN